MHDYGLVSMNTTISRWP